MRRNQSVQKHLHNWDSPRRLFCNVRLHISSRCFDPGGCLSRQRCKSGGGGEYACSVDVVDDFVAGEETEEIVIGFEGVDGCKDMLEVNCIIRICRVVSIERIGRCIDCDISHAYFE
jgi:hypothetical protein